MFLATQKRIVYDQVQSEEKEKLIEEKHRGREKKERDIFGKVKQIILVPEGLLGADLMGTWALIANHRECPLTLDTFGIDKLNQYYSHL